MRFEIGQAVRWNNEQARSEQGSYREGVITEVHQPQVLTGHSVTKFDVQFEDGETRTVPAEELELIERVSGA